MKTVRIVAAVLLLAGCTSEPVRSPLLSVGWPTSDTTSVEPVPADVPEPRPDAPGCPDVIPSDVISELAGTPIDGAHEGRHGGMVWCTFRALQVRFTNSSDEESFAQRRVKHLGQIGPHDRGWVEMPDFYDEAYRDVRGAESIVRFFIAAGQGAAEVWLDGGLHAPPEKSGFQERLLATVVERLR